MSDSLMSDQFADQEVPSEYGYLSGYRSRPVIDQMATLRASFLNLESFDESAAAKEVPAGAEGMFLIPRWQDIATTYNQAVEIVLLKLKEARDGHFHNYCDGKLGPDRLRQTTKKEELFKTLGDEQKEHDVLVVAGQFGIRHRGKSTQRARVVMDGDECALGAFEIGIMLLTHPDRLVDEDDLWIECGGDECAADDGVFCEVPCFTITDQIGFSTVCINVPEECCGTPSAFVASTMISK